MRKGRILFMALVIWAVARLATSVQAYDRKEIDIEYAKAGVIYDAKEMVLETNENIYEEGCQDFATFEISEINESVDKMHIEVVFKMTIRGDYILVVIPYDLDEEYFDEYYKDFDGIRVYDEITDKWYIEEDDIDEFNDMLYDRWPELY